MTRHVDQLAYERPKPETVKLIVEGYGWPIALERWWWMDERTLGEILSRHRKGIAQRNSRKGRVRKNQHGLHHHP
jgi:hypothetical protein